jgi:hypothetical protein
VSRSRSALPVQMHSGRALVRSAAITGLLALGRALMALCVVLSIGAAALGAAAEKLAAR